MAISTESKPQRRNCGNTFVLLLVKGQAKRKVVIPKRIVKSGSPSVARFVSQCGNECTFTLDEIGDQPVRPAQPLGNSQLSTMTLEHQADTEHIAGASRVHLRSHGRWRFRHERALLPVT